jgi:PmbA protein
VDEREILDAVQKLLKAKKAQGDAYLEHRRSLTLRVREGKIEEVTRSDVRGLAVRAIVDGRLGFVHTTKLEPDDLAAATEKACGLARFANVRDDLILSDPAGPADGRDEGTPYNIYDPSIEQKPFEQKRDYLKAAEEAARAVDPMITRSDGASWNESAGSIWLGNTNGLVRHYRKSHVEVGVGVAAESHGELQPGERGFETGEAKNLPEAAELGRQAAERAISLIGGRPVPSGKYPLVFSPDAGWAPLIYLSAALNGESLSRGQSWLSERLKGQADWKLGSDLANVRDNGRLVGGPGSVPFDDEGSETRDLPLLSKGKVAGRLCDLAAGKRLGIPSTGHAQRPGYDGQPDIRSHNLYLEPGQDPPEKILASVDKGFWVWGLSGWWIGLDSSNPQFSSAAFGLWIEKGKPVRPVARVTIAGSVQEIFAGIDAVGSDLLWNRSTVTPTYRVKELSVGGE